MEEEEETSYDMPQETPEQIIDKIRALATDIRNDWSDPRSECRSIWQLCDLLKQKLANQN